jgi:hypothetical protein
MRARIIETTTAITLTLTFQWWIPLTGFETDVRWRSAIGLIATAIVIARAVIYKTVFRLRLAAAPCIMATIWLLLFTADSQSLLSAIAVRRMANEVDRDTVEWNTGGGTLVAAERYIANLKAIKIWDTPGPVQEALRKYTFSLAKVLEADLSAKKSAIDEATTECALAKRKLYDLVLKYE